MTTSMTPTRRAAIAFALAGALLLAACGGGSGSEADGGGADGGPTEAGETTTTAAAEPEAVTAAPVGEVATSEPVPSAGCGTTDVRSVELQKEFLDDSDRWFLLTTPLDHDGDTPLPVVLDFHGLMEGADIHSRMSDMTPDALEEGYVLVTPNGTGTPIRWAVDPDREANADLVYTDALLDQLEAMLCIDTSRVYATGLSNGAFMSSVLACTMSDRIAAVAPVAGIIHPDPCPTERPVPVLAFHGTDDPILLFNGGVGDRLNTVMTEGPGTDPGDEPALPEADLEGEGFPANARAWAEQNGCDAEPVDEQVSDTVLWRTYPCDADAAVEFVVIEGGGHTWPGSQFSANLENIMGVTEMDLDANAEIWAFFQRFALPAS
jgi:polyhydroxybutyrate depolymerase